MAAEAVLAEMTGLDPAACRELLAAAGGDVETALALFFEGGSEAAGAGGGAARRDGVVFETEAAPPAWAEQDFRSLPGTLNVLQRRNGPCGVLACLLAQVAVDRIERNEQAPMDREVAPEEAKRAFFAVLSRCGEKVSFGGRHIASWTDLADEEVSRQGCLVDLVRALVETKTEAALRREIGDQGELPLISGPHALCSSALMTLLMKGSAEGDFSAFNAAQSEVLDDEEWTSKCGFGLLMRSTEQIKVANGLMFPKHPVWVLHGGDHFTLLIHLGKAEDGSQRLLHLNGLPPAGPSNVMLALHASADASRVKSSAERPLYIKPVPGEIDDIVQAHPEDRAKFKDDWRQWRLECVLAVDDPSVQDSNLDPRPESSITRFDVGPLPTPGSKFRCAACYRDRFRTMNFGEQVMREGQTACAICGKELAEAQWSIWLPYRQLPQSIRSRADRMYAPKLLIILRSRWPDCDVSVLEKASAPLPST